MFHHNSCLVAREGDKLLVRSSNSVVAAQEMRSAQDQVAYNRGEEEIGEARMEMSDDGNSAEGLIEGRHETRDHVIMYRGSLEGEENPVWESMCVMKRYESVVETIPGMEEEEFHCKKIHNEEGNSDE